MKPKLTMIGVGMGDMSLLTRRAHEKIENAGRILATHRIAADFAGLNPEIRSADMSEIRRALADECDCTVLLSGDVGFFSLSSVLAEEFSGRYDMEIINGLDSLQYFCGKLGMNYDDVKAISVHGRTDRAAAAVAYNFRVFALTGGENGVEQVLNRLNSTGLSHIKVYVGENLSYPTEKIIVGTASELCGGNFSRLSVLLLENEAAVCPSKRLSDEDFLRGDVPMTKEAVRVLSCSRLDIKPTDTVWDVGAGTGSVSVALARAAFEGVVYAVEKEPDALELIAKNRSKLGAYNIEITAAQAPEGLAGLPPPDRVFIGGSAGNLRIILEAVLQKTAKCVVCINAITLETLNEAILCFNEMNFTDVEIECVNVAKSRTAGNYHLMMAQNPVYIVSACIDLTEAKV